MPCVYLLGLRHDISSAIATTAFGIASLIVLGLIFGTKYLPMFGMKTMLPKILDETYQESSQSMSHTQYLSPDILRTMDPDDQYAYYTLQIRKYTLLRMSINNSSQEKSHNSSHRIQSHNPDQEFNALEANQQPEDISSSHNKKFADNVEEEEF